MTAYLDPKRLQALRKNSNNQRSRYHCSEKEIDLYSLLDPSYREELRRMQAIDQLDLEERDLVSLRCGILEYEGQGRKTYKFLAKVKGKSIRTIKRIFYKIKKKLRIIY